MTKMMTIRRLSAILYAIVSGVVVAFQIALAAGAPWGEYAMGGAFPGQFPPALRIAALIQAALLVGLAVIVLARAGLVALWSRASALAHMGRGGVFSFEFCSEPDHTQRG